MYGILDIPAINSDTGDDSLLLCSFIAPTRVNSVKVVKSGSTLSLRTIRYATTPQRWEIESDTAILNSSADLFTHMISNNNINSIFVRPPLPVKSYSKATGYARPAAGDSVAYPASQRGYAESDGTADSNASYSTGANSISLTLDPSSSIFKSDFIRFDSHDKVYMVTDVQSINTTLHTSSISLFPSLINGIALNETIYLGKKATMKMTYDISNIIGISYIATEWLMMVFWQIPVQ